MMVIWFLCTALKLPLSVPQALLGTVSAEPVHPGRSGSRGHSRVAPLFRPLFRAPSKSSPLVGEIVRFTGHTDGGLSTDLALGREHDKLNTPLPTLCARGDPNSFAVAWPILVWPVESRRPDG